MLVLTRSTDDVECRVEADEHEGGREMDAGGGCCREDGEKVDGDDEEVEVEEVEEVEEVVDVEVVEEDVEEEVDVDVEEVDVDMDVDGCGWVEEVTAVGENEVEDGGDAGVVEKPEKDENEFDAAGTAVALGDDAEDAAPNAEEEGAADEDCASDDEAEFLSVS
jgi:hypothetical protein